MNDRIISINNLIDIEVKLFPPRKLDVKVI